MDASDTARDSAATTQPLLVSSLPGYAYTEITTNEPRLLQQSSRLFAGAHSLPATGLWNVTVLTHVLKHGETDLEPAIRADEHLYSGAAAD